MAHLVAGVLAALFAGVGRDQAERAHLVCPFLIVIACPARLAEMVLPQVAHLMDQS